MQLYNTLTRSIEPFNPLKDKTATLYCCGPTVYDYTHIGHIRKYVMDDILRRTLEFAGYEVKEVMNITDVGHLTDDADEGEDKLEKGAAKTGKSVQEVAKFYTEFFKKTMEEVNVKLPEGKLLCKATEHIEDMIKLIQKLESKGFTYATDEAIYFDTTKFPAYGNLSGQKMEEKKQAVREGVHVDKGKKNPADFALWFKRTGRFANHTMHWDPKIWGADYGDGFPGWHIECSAMSMKYLGDQLDIHTGGIDHIPVHHENEIAQSEAATGKKFVNYWVHHNFLMVDGQKMSKSLENFYTIEDVEERGIKPLALRLLFMQTHYRQEMNFTWESAEAANEAYKRLQDKIITLQKTRAEKNLQEKYQWTDQERDLAATFRNDFKEAIENDLQTPKALAIMWNMLKSELSENPKLLLLQEFDTVFGFKLKTQAEQKIVKELPDDVKMLQSDREIARASQNWQRSDELRKQIEELGYIVEDYASGTVIHKK